MKKIVSFLLVLLLSVTANSGALLSLSSVGLSKKETPVASEVADNYSAYTGTSKNEAELDLLKNEIESMGGYMESYSSEDEYLAAQKKKDQAAVKNAKTVSSLASTASFEPVMQTITVMTTATGSEANKNYIKSKPIANAVVRIDGVPRYTDRNGQITTKIDREIIELYVEKTTEDITYNPYIEIMDVTGKDKVVYLKQSNDDIDVYAAMFYYFGKNFNLLEQVCYFNKGYFRKRSELDIKCNVKADQYYILVNGEKRFFSSTGAFYNINFDNYTKNDNFSIQVIYNGITSKTYDLLLKVVKPEIFSPDIPNGNLHQDIGDEAFGDLGNVDFDFADFIEGTIHKYLLNNDKVKLNFGPSSINLGYLYDPSTGGIEFTVGFSVEIDLGAKKAKEIQEQQNQIEELERQNRENQESIDDISKRLVANQTKIDELNKQMEKPNANKQAYIDKKNDLLNDLHADLAELKDAQDDPEYKAIEAEIKKTNKNVADNLRGYEKRGKEVNDQIAELSRRQNAGEKNIESLSNALKQIPELKKNAEKMKDLFNGTSGGSKVGFTVDFEVTGVIYYSCATQQFTKVEISIGAKVKISYTFQTVVIAIIPIPCFFKIEASVGLKLQLNFLLNEPFDFMKFMNRLELILSLSLRVDAGIGVSGAVSAGIFGSVELAIGFRIGLLFNGQQPFSVTVNWGIGMKFQLLFLEYEISHFEQTKIVEYPDAMETTAFMSTLMARSYFLNGMDIELSEQQLFGNVFQSSTSKLFELDNEKKLLMWLEDSPLRDTYNRSVLKYSIFDGTDWGVPCDLYNDGFADFSFDAIQTNGDIYVAWQKGRRNFTEHDEPSTMLIESDIYTAKYNQISGEFENVAIVCDNDDMKFSPEIALQETKSDKITITWLANSENNIFGDSGINSIIYSEYQDAAWSIPECVYSINAAITGYCAAIKSGKLTFAVSVNNDNNIVSGNNAIYIITEETSYKLADTKGLYLQFSLIDGKIVLFFYNEASIFQSIDLINTESIINNITSNDYRIYTNSDSAVIFYEKITGEYKQAYCAVRSSSGLWTSDIQLTYEEAYVNNTSGLISSDRTVSFSYNLQDADGHTVLCYNEKTLNAEIEIEDVTFIYDITDGLDNLMSVMITNNGCVNITSLALNCFGQTEIMQLDEPIKVNETRFINCIFTVGLIKGVNPYLTVVGQSEEKLECFDIYEINTVLTDLAIGIGVDILDNKQQFCLIISNNSEYETNAALNIYLNGILIEERDMFLDAFITSEVTLSYNYLEKDDYICFEIVSEIIDKNNSNNLCGTFSLFDENVETLIQNKYFNQMQIAKTL